MSKSFCEIFVLNLTSMRTSISPLKILLNMFGFSWMLKIFHFLFRPRTSQYRCLQQAHCQNSSTFSSAHCGKTWDHGADESAYLAERGRGENSPLHRIQRERSCDWMIFKLNVVITWWGWRGVGCMGGEGVSWV